MHGTLDHGTWTLARVTDLRRLIEEKYTASEAARELGITRNAAIGKAHRLGLHFDSQDPRNIYFRKLRPPRAPREQRIRLRKAKPKMQIEMAPEPDALNLTFQQLEKNDCRYVVTADHPMLFCGHPKSAGSSYCAHHFHICTVPMQSKYREPRPR